MHAQTKTTIRSLTALVAMLTVTAAMAANGTTPLSECVDKVVAACNEGSHPVACTDNGIDQCEDEFGSQVHAAGLGFAVVPQNPPRSLGLRTR